ncbi:hypothetical protein ABZ645_10540 [Nocardiopsis alba]
MVAGDVEFGLRRRRPLRVVAGDVEFGLRRRRPLRVVVGDGRAE